MSRYGNANQLHGLQDRDRKGSGFAECKCGERSSALMQSRNERRMWQQHHRDSVNLEMARNKRRSFWVMNEAGISYRQLDVWVRNGHLHPGSTNGGSFADRVWPESEALIAVEMGRLTRAGFTVYAAARVARQHVMEPSPDGSYKLESGVRIRLANRKAAA